MPIRHIVPLVCVALGLGLAACGGDSEPKTGATTEEEQVTTTPLTQETETGTTSEAGASGTNTEPGSIGTRGGTTPPGATLKLGQTAKVKRKPLNAPFDSKAFYVIDTAVLKIEKGSQADFTNVNLEPEQKKATPYYVRIRVSNPGSKVPAAEDPVLGYDAVDDRGQRQGRVIFLGTFASCDYADVPKPFAKGKSYETCLVYLVPGGGSIEEVQWSGADDYASDSITWK
ncbi:MAG: hypothetical protein ABR583_13490 [Gaiellaceae bacterium]